MLNFLYYIKYFFYIAFNWNLRLAWFSIYHEILGERKYSINTTRLDDLQKLEVIGRNKMQAEIYQGASYYLLEALFTELHKLNAPNDIVDLGSGKGRVMVVAAHFGFTRITGIEFAKSLCIEAEKNCKKISEEFPQASWKIVHADASAYKFTKLDHVFFFFNPFKESVMKIVLQNILQSLRDHPRKIFIVYMNPQLKQLFLKSGFKQSAYIRKMQFVEAAIYEKE